MKTPEAGIPGVDPNDPRMTLIYFLLHPDGLPDEVLAQYRQVLREQMPDVLAAIQTRLAGFSTELTDNAATDIPDQLELDL